MSKYARKYGSSLDRNHKEISDALQKAGYSVGEVSASGGFCDLVCARYPDRTVLFEAKMLDANIYLSQLEFASKWLGYFCFVDTAEQALQAMDDPDSYCLSTSDKEWIAGYVIRRGQEYKDNKMKFSAFKKAFEARKEL